MTCLGEMATFLPGKKAKKKKKKTHHKEEKFEAEPNEIELVTILKSKMLKTVSGSFNHYATRFVDPALGFALGWNYW